MSDWIAIGRKTHHVSAYLVKDGKIADQSSGETEAAALAELDSKIDRILHIGAAQPSLVPTSLLPDSGHVLPGLVQDQPSDSIDAWTRLFAIGFHTLSPNWDGVICAQSNELSHWIHLSAGEVVSTKSFLTPKLVTVLGGAQTTDIDAMTESLSRPEQLAAHLRQAELSFNTAAITGHLVGAEMAAARPYWLGQQVALISEVPERMSDALSAQSVPFVQYHPNDLVSPALMALGQALGFEE